jgi:3',5'-cyclic-AMP phosphodiesterase
MMMSRFSALPPSPEGRTGYSRRRFLRQLLGASAFGLTGAAGFDSLFAQGAPHAKAEGFRFAFVTDLHLLQGGALRSVQGIVQCLAAVEKLDPRPDFILCGGDLVDSIRDMTLPGAETALDFFIKLWNDHTSLPTHWTFGNHDLAGTANPYALSSDAEYGKGLFKDRLKLPQLFYSYDVKGWHFVVLDDIAMEANGYHGDFFPDELAFLQADLDAHSSVPTIVCTHIPIVSNVPLAMSLAGKPVPDTLVCRNGCELTNDLPRHNIRAVLSGHLHFYEEIKQNGIQIINSGAVCGSYWRGPNHGCPEGFGVVDLGADGSVKFDYRTYGWKA